MLWRYQKNHVAMLSCQSIMRRGGAEADVIRIGDATGERQKIAIAQGVRALLRWYQQILAPGSSLQPALAAQGTDDFVGGLEAGAQ